MSTPSRGSGHCFAPGCAHTGAFPKKSCRFIWAFLSLCITSGGAVGHYWDRFWTLFCYQWHVLKTQYELKRFSELIEYAASRHQVDAKLVHAVIQAESANNSSAQSQKGAKGLMQLMPDTAQRFGFIDRNDPNQNVDDGTRYLKYLIKLFYHNIGLAVAAYNAGENTVIRYNN